MFFRVGRNVYVFIRHFTGWDFNLNIPSCLVVHILRDLYHKLFDKRSNIEVPHHRCFPFLNPENFFRNGDFHILLHLYLTGQAGTFIEFPL